MEYWIVLGLLAAAETAFACLQIKRGMDKATFLRRRVVLRAIELAVAVAALVLPIWGQRWRFTGVVALTSILLVWAVLSYLVRHKQVTGRRGKVSAVCGATFCTLFLALALVPALVFTGYEGLPTTGQYQVREAGAIMTDTSRAEAHETDGSSREVPVHFVYPDALGSYPLVVFDHGAFGYWESNYSTYAELASHGYVVASIEDPYDSLFTHDTTGKLITVDPDFMQTVITMQDSDASLEEQNATEQDWLSVRVADMNFALDTIKTAAGSGKLDDTWYTPSDADRAGILDALGMMDTSEIGLMGHSIGGAAAMDVARHRDDITAVIDLDGTMLGEQTVEGGTYVYNQDPYPVPFLSMNNEAHGRQYQEGNPDGSEYVNQYVVEHAIDGRSLVFPGTGHMDFTDLPLLSPTLAGMLGTGTVDPHEFVPRMNSIIVGYFDYYLKGEGDLSALC